MYKTIWITAGVAAVLLGLACSASGAPTETSQQHESTAARNQVGQTEASGSSGSSQQRLEPTATPQDDGDQQRGSTPAIQGRLEPTTTPPGNESFGDSGQDSGTLAQGSISSFQEEIGNAYPGLLSLPECSASTQLTIAPLADDAYEMILPLGLLTTPQWVLPSSHVYYQLVREISPSGGYGSPAIADVRAPADIRILGVDSSESMGGPQGDYTDYEITFAPCQGRMYKLLHVSTMNAQLQQLFDATEAQSCTEYGGGTTQNRLCVKKLNLDMAVETVIGTTGGKVSSAMDLEAYDLAGPSLAYANPARMGGRVESLLRLKVACPFDDFAPEVRESQLARIGDIGANRLRTAEPLCGEVMQDIPGTAQGNWYAGGTESPVGWNQQLGLLHDYIDPTLATISIGGILTGHGNWLFEPEPSGSTNRDFSAVTADGTTYCFQGGTTKQSSQAQKLFPGRLLVSMTSDTEMLVERQDGDCAGVLAFVEPVTYQR
ncbi:MAG: hypothetical protein BZY87_07455 [SAR202 cluster bacterium Io17-Chloro-G6]|nr:MAG: hypothetical protein BZY87_07455 [SAR202 cluster bacterium Io17-Chloro-G6]